MNKLSLVIKCPNLQVPLIEKRNNFPLKLTFLPFSLPLFKLDVIHQWISLWRGWEGVWGFLFHALSVED